MVGSGPNPILRVWNRDKLKSGTFQIRKVPRSEIRTVYHEEDLNAGKSEKLKVLYFDEAKGWREEGISSLVYWQTRHDPVSLPLGFSVNTDIRVPRLSVARPSLPTGYHTTL